MDKPLTKEQEDRLVATINEWNDICADIKPIDVMQSKKDIIEYMNILNETKPIDWDEVIPPADFDSFVVLDGPLEGIIAVSFIEQALPKVQADLGISDIPDYVILRKITDIITRLSKEYAKYRLEHNHFPNNDKNYVATKPTNITGGLDSFWPEIKDSIEPLLREYFVYDSTYAKYACYGSLDGPWLAFYAFVGKEFDIKEVDYFKPLFSLARNCGIWWPLQGFAIITQKPILNNITQHQHQFHSTNGVPILKYADGLEVYFWQGVRIPSWVFRHPEKLTVDVILKERNLELRSRYIDIFGISRFAEEMNPQLVDDNPEFGQLLEVFPVAPDEDLPNDEVLPIVLLKVINSTPEGVWQKRNGNEPVDNSLLESHPAVDTTGWDLNQYKFMPELKDGELHFKTYYLRVPPEIRTAKAAYEWINNTSEKTEAQA